MATDESREQTEMAKEAGLEGEGLSALLRDERARQREREKEEREREKEEREREKDEREREKEEREREKEEREREKDEREREKEEREREKEEREREEREADRRHELELIQLRSHVNTSGQPEQGNRTRWFSGAVPKLPSFDERTNDFE